MKSFHVFNVLSDISQLNGSYQSQYQRRCLRKLKTHTTLVSIVNINMTTTSIERRSIALRLQRLFSNANAKYQSDWNVYWYFRVTLTYIAHNANCSFVAMLLQSHTYSLQPFHGGEEWRHMNWYSCLNELIQLMNWYSCLNELIQLITVQRAECS